MGSRWNIITTLHGTNILKVKEGRNDDDDDDDNDTHIPNEAIEPQMIVTTMSIHPKIQILQLVILLGHESQGHHNLRLFKSAKNIGIGWTWYANPHGGLNIYFSNYMFLW